MVDAVSKISTENPESEQWKLLRQFSYPPNITRYLNKNGYINFDEKLPDYISGCISQADAYFVAAASAPLDISPLITYYGTTNLLAGVSALLDAKKPNIKGHGLTLRSKETGRIASTEIVPRVNQESGLHVFSRLFAERPFTNGGIVWTLEEVLGSVPDLKSDFEQCYSKSQTFVIPVEIVKNEYRTVERVIIGDFLGYENPIAALEQVHGFREAYLMPKIMEHRGYIILSRKVDSEEIGTHSIFGQKYLEVGHMKGDKLVFPGQIITMYMGLFALGYISRYYPQVWNPFVKSDVSGERLVIESFVDICRRYLPNLLINKLYSTRFQFVYEINQVIDITSDDKRDLKELVRKEIESYIKRQNESV